MFQTIKITALFQSTIQFGIEFCVIYVVSVLVTRFFWCLDISNLDCCLYNHLPLTYFLRLLTHILNDQTD